MSVQCFKCLGLIRKQTGPRSFSLWGLRPAYPFPSMHFRDLHWSTSSTWAFFPAFLSVHEPRSPSISVSRTWPRQCHWHRHQSQFKKHIRHTKHKWFAFSITHVAILISSWKQKKTWTHMTSFPFCIPFCSGPKKAKVCYHRGRFRKHQVSSSPLWHLNKFFLAFTHDVGNSPTSCFLVFLGWQCLLIPLYYFLFIF